MQTLFSHVDSIWVNRAVYDWHVLNIQALPHNVQTNQYNVLTQNYSLLVKFFNILFSLQGSIPNAPNS